MEAESTNHVRKHQRHKRGRKRLPNKDVDKEGANDGKMRCIICTDPMTIISFGSCNHPTCHICSLRLRALYQNKACPLCKADLDTVIFTDELGASFEEIDSKALANKDERLGIRFVTAGIYEQTIKLLHFNCPFRDCDVVCAGGYPDLKKHVRDDHGLVMCDICIASKKVFSHEHQLFTPSSLRQHKLFGDKHDMSFKGHPKCHFCNQFFYGPDELYDHCKKKHETCFLCERSGIRNEYFRNYSELEDHFRTEHKLCPSPECLAQKFVVFDSEIDLQAHDMEVHNHNGGKSITGRREYRPVTLEFGQQNASRASGTFNGSFSGDLNESIFSNIGPRGTVVGPSNAAAPLQGNLLNDVDFPSFQQALNLSEAPSAAPQAAKPLVKPSWVAASHGRNMGTLSPLEFPPLVATAASTKTAARFGKAAPERKLGQSRHTSARDLEGVTLERALQNLLYERSDGECATKLHQLLGGKASPQLGEFSEALVDFCHGKVTARDLLDRLYNWCTSFAGGHKASRADVSRLWMLLAGELEAIVNSLSLSEFAAINIDANAVSLSGNSVWSRGRLSAPHRNSRSRVNVDFKGLFGVVENKWLADNEPLSRLSSSIGTNFLTLSSMSTASLAKKAKAAPKILIIKDRKDVPRTPSVATLSTKKFTQNNRLDSNAYQTIADKMVALNASRATMGDFSSSEPANNSNAIKSNANKSNANNSKKKEKKVVLFSAKG